MIDIQEFFNAKSAEWALERSQEMVTLGELVGMLNNIDGKLPVYINDAEEGALVPTGLSSYRGYYSDIQIEYEQDTPADEVNVATFRIWLSEAIGKTYTGYKGGDFTMSKITPVWVDTYGRCRGVHVTGVEVVDGTCVIQTGIRHD